MENDSRNSRVKNMTSAVGGSSGTTRTSSGSSSGSSRSARVAPSMRTGSTRVRSVDMSSVDTPSRKAPERSSSRIGSPSGISRSGSSGSSARKSSSRTSASRTSSSRSSASTRTSSSARTSSSTRTVSARTASVRPSSSAPATRAASAQAVSDSTENTGRITTAANRNYTDILEEKRNARAASSKPAASSRTSAARSSSRKRSSSRSRGISGFAKFLIIYGAIFAVAIIVIAIVLTAYLSKYEKGQPSHVAESIVEEFSSTQKLKSFLEKNKAVVKSNESILDFEDSYYNLVDGKKISFVTDSSKTTSELSAYKITADNSLVAEVELTKDNNTWKLSSIDTSAAFKDVKGYSVLVPEGSTVTVNGIQLSEDSITGTGIPAVLEYSSQFINSKPEFTTYTVKLASGGVPSVSGTDANGQALVFTQNETSFVAGGGATSSFVDSVKERVETGVREYALYFEYLAFDLESYILDDCEQHEFIFGSENFDRIDPWLYNWDYINTHEFREFSVSNYTVYSEDCFTTDVNYDLLITFNHDGPYGYKDLPDDNPTMDGTWVWVLDDGEWYISDIIINY